MKRSSVLRRFLVGVLTCAGWLAGPQPASAQYWGTTSTATSASIPAASPGPGSMSPSRLCSGTPTTSRTPTATPSRARSSRASTCARCFRRSSSSRPRNCSVPTTGSWWRCPSRPSGPNARSRSASSRRLGFSTTSMSCRCISDGIHHAPTSSPATGFYRADRAVRGGRQRQRRARHVVARDSSRHHGLPRFGEEGQRRDDGVLRDALEQEGPGSESRQPPDARRRRGLQRAEDRRRIRLSATTSRASCRTTAAPMSRSRRSRPSICTARTGCSASVPT